MKKILLTLTTIGALALSGNSFANDTYKIDGAHGEVGFAVTHLVISKVKGVFDSCDATLVVGADGKLVSAEATIQVDSINTRNEDRDKHLKNDDFFSAEKFPTITFKSKRVGPEGIVADFTIRDVTKEITLPYTLAGPIQDPWGNTKLGFAAEIEINRRDYGMTYGVPAVVGDTVTITVDSEFTKEKAEAAE